MFLILRNAQWRQCVVGSTGFQAGIPQVLNGWGSPYVNISGNKNHLEKQLVGEVDSNVTCVKPRAPKW